MSRTASMQHCYSINQINVDRSMLILGNPFLSSLMNQSASQTQTGPFTILLNDLWSPTSVVLQFVRGRRTLQWNGQLIYQAKHRSATGKQKAVNENCYYYYQRINFVVKIKQSKHRIQKYLLK